MATEDESENLGNEIKKYDFQELRGLVESETWRKLTPNYPSTDALLPRDLTPKQINTAINTIINQVV